MKEFDQVMSCVIQQCVDNGLPAENVPHVFTRADIREAEFKRVVSEDSPYVTFQVDCYLFLVFLRPWLTLPVLDH